MNYLKEKFEQRNDEFLVKSFELDGTDFLWEIVLHAENPDVNQKAILTLVRLQKNFSPELQPGILQSREKFLHRCIVSLQDSARIMTSTSPSSSEHDHAANVANRVVNLLRTFIDFLEANLPSLNHGSAGSSQTGALLKINVKGAGNQAVYGTFEIFENEAARELKKKVAAKLNTTADMLRLIGTPMSLILYPFLVLTSN